MRLYLVRHLMPFAADGICYGRTDLRVDSAMEAAAMPALRERLPHHAPVISSPLQRCARLATGLGTDVRFDARLAELHFGAWEMEHWDSIPRAEIDAWAADVVHYRPGGGESVHDMALRISAFYDELMAEAHASAIVVCHAGAIRLLLARQRGQDPEQMARTAAEQPHAIAYGEVVVIDCV
jgi:alpha-ribazole phosphatase